jgi:Tol biopolymer transport system component
MLTRILTAALAVLAAWGCDRLSSRLAERSEAPVAVAAARSWRFEEPPADTLPAMTRRVWYGPQVDPSGSPSPDGLTYAYRDQATGDIVLRDLESGELRRLTHNRAPNDPGTGYWPRFSRDGSQVAYAWSDWGNSNFQLRVVDVAGGEPRVIYAEEPSPWINAEDWSPDGTTIVAGRIRSDGVIEAVSISLADGSVRVLKEYERLLGSGPAGVANFSPDGRFVVDAGPAGDGRTDRDLFVMAADGSWESRLLDHPANDFVLGWAPNGSVLFASDRTGTLGAWLLPVRDGRASGPPRLVKPDLWRARPIGFTRDGRYFYSVDAGSSEIYVATLDGDSRSVTRAPVRLEAATLGLQHVPEWSPDGRYLAYVVETDGSGAGPSFYLAVRSLQTGEVREHRLPEGLRYATAIRWMPDGRSLLLWAAGSEGEELLRIDVQTGRTDQPFSIPSTDFGTWGFEILPGGESVLYSVLHRKDESLPDDQMRYEIKIRDLEDGAEREIYSLIWTMPPPGGEVRALFSPTISRDGRLVAFRDGDPRNARIMVMPVAGGEPRELAAAVITSPTFTFSPSNARAVTFTPDGGAVLFVSLSGDDDPTMHVYRVGLDGGEPEPIGLAMEGLGRIRFHPDGRRIVFTAGLPSQEEIWVLEGFLPGEGDTGGSPSGG